MSERCSHYDEWEAAMYDDIWRELSTRDVPFWVSLADEAGGPVLELACGTGRVAIPTARAGHQVTGLDRSPHMLAVARRKLDCEEPGVQGRLRLLEGDMADFRLGQQFDLITVPFRSFQHLLTRAAQRSCLARCLEHLSPDGRLALSVAHTKRVPREPEQLARTHRRPDGVVIHETADVWHDPVRQVVGWETRMEWTEPDGEPGTHLYAGECRYFYRLELEWMLEACGFSVEAVYGGFDRAPLSEESGDIVLVARRAV